VKVFKADPCLFIDQKAVGKMIIMGIELSLAANRPISNRHLLLACRDPASVEFCFAMGMNYVLCRPI